MFYFHQDMALRTPRHVGDLGNIVSDIFGIADVNITDSIVKLSGEYSVISRSFVVHLYEDDLGLGGDDTSLANGNCGARLACGIIDELKSSSGRPSIIFYQFLVIALIIFLSY